MQHLQDAFCELNTNTSRLRYFPCNAVTSAYSYVSFSIFFLLDCFRPSCRNLYTILRWLDFDILVRRSLHVLHAFLPDWCRSGGVRFQAKILTWSQVTVAPNLHLVFQERCAEVPWFDGEENLCGAIGDFDFKATRRFKWWTFHELNDLMNWNNVLLIDSYILVGAMSC